MKSFWISAVSFGLLAAVAAAGPPCSGRPSGGGCGPQSPVLSSQGGYHRMYGKAFGGGYYYPGKSHTHWTYHGYSAKYRCECYWCPSTCCYYYWCAPAGCYYPVSYFNYAPPAADPAGSYGPTAPGATNSPPPFTTGEPGAQNQSPVQTQTPSEHSAHGPAGQAGPPAAPPASPVARPPGGGPPAGVSPAGPGRVDEVNPKVAAALAKLAPEDRGLAAAQKFCPILADNELGSMGAPIKVVLDGQTVFVCCKGCEKSAQKDPVRTLQKVIELKAKNAGNEK